MRSRNASHFAIDRVNVDMNCMATAKFFKTLKTLFAGGSRQDSVEEGVSVQATSPALNPPTSPRLDVDLSRVPATAKDRVTTIQTLIADLESRACSRGFTGSELAELTQIGTVYIPRLLQSYAHIPPKHRADIFRDTGRSASFLLVERLDKIIERLNHISRELARGHLDEFAENMRFIDLRYGSADSAFD